MGGSDEYQVERPSGNGRASGRDDTQELVSKRRELFGNKTPKERSVSPMCGEATQVNAGVGSPYENDAAA